MITELDTWDMDTIDERDGYDITHKPDLTRRNMNLLMDKINELVLAMNTLTEAS